MEKTIAAIKEEFPDVWAAAIERTNGNETAAVLLIKQVVSKLESEEKNG